MAELVDFNDFAASAAASADQFHRDGFLVLENLLEVEAVHRLHGQAMQNFDELKNILWRRKVEEKVVAGEGARVDTTVQTSSSLDALSLAHPTDSAEVAMSDMMGIGIKHCFKEIVQRHPHRFEMPYRMDEDQYAVVLQCPQIMNVVKRILGEDCIVINKSLVVSSPGASDQAWHSDGPHISATDDLPCHCLNVFVPLVNVTEQNGPTQFRPGSVNMTRNLKVEMLKAMARKTLRPIEGPALSIGSVLLFDYRVLHRGTANRTLQPRPVLVYTFAKPFYRDTLNFPRNSVFDAVPMRTNGESTLEC